MSVSRIWVVGDYKNGKRAPQDQYRVQLVTCRLAKARRRKPSLHGWGMEIFKCESSEKARETFTGARVSYL